jgi:hypothetical protein
MTRQFLVKRTMPELKRLPEQKWHWLQVEDPFPQLPGANGCFLGPSGTGKTTTLLALLTGPCPFSALHVFSPSVHLDSAWDEIKNNFARCLEGNSFNDARDDNVLMKVLDSQKKKTPNLKRENSKNPLPQALIIIDDFANNPQVLHHSGGIMTTLFVRGRPFGVSTWISLRKLTAISTVARVNFKFLCVWRVRNYREIQALLEELSAIYPVAVLQEMYDQAINDQDYFFGS